MERDYRGGALMTTNAVAGSPSLYESGADAIALEGVCNVVRSGLVKYCSEDCMTRVPLPLHCQLYVGSCRLVRSWLQGCAASKLPYDLRAGHEHDQVQVHRVGERLKIGLLPE